ncbi:MAG TPA: sulfotransferase family protein [Gammaproteobacteria bacterium]|nr:sulfotransferase family protein [Gammaproteobacteria bacterium]
MHTRLPDTAAGRDAGGTLEEAFGLFNAGDLTASLELCRRLCEAGRADARLWCLRAVIEGRRKDVWSALQSAKKAVELAPDNVDCWFNLGLAQLYCNFPVAALASFRRVREKNPGHRFVWQFLGQSYEGCGDYEKAVDCYQRTLDSFPGDVAILSFVARRFEMMQMADRCRELARKIITLEPDHVDANIMLARLDRYDGNHEPARERLDRLLQADLAVVDRVNVCNEKGHLLDRMGEYGNAFECFAAKRMLENTDNARQFDAGVIHQQVRRLKRAITPEAVQSWERYDCRDGLPSPVFLVAFPRSGTTLLEKILATNESLVTSNESNLLQYVRGSLKRIARSGHDYPDVLNHLDRRQILSARRLYWEYARAVLGAEIEGKVLLDKLPLNIIDVALINRIFPESRILFVSRDPRDVCLSNLMQIYLQNNAMSAFNTLEGSARLYADVMGLWFYYRKTLEMNLFEIRYEDLVSDPERHVRELIGFLGFEWSDAYLNHSDRSNYKYLSTPSVLDVNRPIYRRARFRWKNYRRQLEPVMEVLRAPVGKLGYMGDGD